ncbi:MAG: 6-hydroxymethylpterin diphosphokinase MptE-like protein [Clostridiaceae bacterium]|nr:6-hydroxymethylpterin diphosphokinase MptE-like protein [Clostridiaceae bacterium]
MLLNNEQLIKRKCKWILDKMNSADDHRINGEIEVEKNTGRAPTIYVKDAGKKIYLHSKYDPYEEAKRIIGHIENIGNYEHIVFLGFGLGYHVEYFTKRFPGIPFSIFEPEPDIFKKCLGNCDIGFIEKDTFNNFYFADPESQKELEEFLNSLDCNILAIPLPSYETAFPEDYKSFYRIFGQYFDNARIIDNTQKNNEKLHTLNVLNNFGYIMNTPSIFRHDNDLFRNKPAIIASAGPSLEYEIENLRYVKEKGLAYIFSAGSSINTLIENNIHPHACWSIEPNERSRIVYEKMIFRGIKSIPLIFGSTTSPAVVKSYPGNLFHFITAKDLVSPYYLDSSLGNDEIIGTASSVAVVTLLALHKLGFSPIILVGQNLAYKDQRYYSKGIDHNYGSGTIDKEHFEHLYKVPGVDGSYVYADDALNCFRKDMESYIRNYGITDVINTTRNGAVIKGTKFVPLDELLKNSRKDKVVDPHWELKLHNDYNKEIIKKQSSSLKIEIDKFYKTMDELKALPDNIHAAASFYKIFNDIVNNKFFHVFLYSMNTYECKLLIKDIKTKNNNDPAILSVSLYERFINFINACVNDLDVILPFIEELDRNIS